MERRELGDYQDCKNYYLQDVADRIFGAKKALVKQTPIMRCIGVYRTILPFERNAIMLLWGFTLRLCSLLYLVEQTTTGLGRQCFLKRKILWRERDKGECMDPRWDWQVMGGWHHYELCKDTDISLEGKLDSLHMQLSCGLVKGDLDKWHDELSGSTLTFILEGCLLSSPQSASIIDRKALFSFGKRWKNSVGIIKIRLRTLSC